MIVYSIFAEMTNNNIVDKLKLPPRTIQRIMEQLEDTIFDLEAVVARSIQIKNEE